MENNRRCTIFKKFTKATRPKSCLFVAILVLYTFAISSLIARIGFIDIQSGRTKFIYKLAGIKLWEVHGYNDHSFIWLPPRHPVWREFLTESFFGLYTRTDSVYPNFTYNFYYIYNYLRKKNASVLDMNEAFGKYFDLYLQEGPLMPLEGGGPEESEGLYVWAYHDGKQYRLHP